MTVNRSQSPTAAGGGTLAAIIKTTDMIVRPLIVIALSLLLHSCNQTDTGTNKEATFKQFTDSLPTITLPLILSCDNNLTPIKTSLPDSLIQKYSDCCQYVFGKLPDTKDYSAIIYILPATDYVPILVVSDNSGNKLTSLTLLKECGGGEICSHGTSWAEITKNFQITIIDSVTTCKLDSLDNIVPGSKNIDVTTSAFILESNGKLTQKK